MNKKPSAKTMYLKSGSARKEAYFKESLHGMIDLILSSSSTYCKNKYFQGGKEKGTRRDKLKAFEIIREIYPRKRNENCTTTEKCHLM